MKKNPKCVYYITPRQHDTRSYIKIEYDDKLLALEISDAGPYMVALMHNIL
jgi:hypothetical protein